MKKTNNSRPKRAAVLASLRKETDHALVDLISWRVASMVEQRLNFFPVICPGGGLHL